MGIRYTVRRGDSLWSLAGRYLSDFTRYQDICDYHNEHAQKHRRVAGMPLIAIKDPNLIYVGQILMIPGRGERPAAAGPKGTKAEAGTLATPIDAKVEFTIDPAKSGRSPASGASKNAPGGDKFAVPLDLKADQRLGAPIRYGPYNTPDYTMFGELTGRIVLENMNPDRHRSNWELAISDNENVLSRKLKDQYEQAFLELTADMGMAFNPATGIATVRPRIAAKAGLGPYEFRVEADGPNHFTYYADLDPIKGTLDLAGRKFRYSSKLSVMVDITLHPMPRGPKAVRLPQEQPLRLPENPKSDNLKAVSVLAAFVVAVIIVVTEGEAIIMRISDSMGMQRCPALRSPFWLTINPYRSGPKNA